MNYSPLKLSVAGITALVLLAGCASNEPEEQTPAPTTAAQSETPAAKPTAASLGTEQGNEHFAINLKAPAGQVKVGKATFSASVSHHGQPTKEAKVTLRLSMPTMNMGGPTVELKHVKDGIYEGQADLSMGGDWQAVVSVDEEGHTAEATYGFVVMQ